MFKRETLTFLCCPAANKCIISVTHSALCPSSTEVTSQHHQSIKFNFTRFLRTRIFDVMLKHSPMRITMHFGVKFSTNASIASEAFDSSCQLKRSLFPCNAQSTAKFIKSNLSASIKIASQIMIDIAFQKCFRNSQHLSRCFFSISLSPPFFSEDCHILLAESVAFLRFRIHCENFSVLIAEQSRARTSLVALPNGSPSTNRR